MLTLGRFYRVCLYICCLCHCNTLYFFDQVYHQSASIHGTG